MIKIPTWKLVLLLIYSCVVTSAFMFVFSLVIQWIAISGNSVNFGGSHQLYIAI
jgi:hypothetical protein